MRYRMLGKSNIEVSELGLGTMTFGEQNDELESHRLLDIAVDSGVNFIDTAEMYPVPPRAETVGRSESMIGTWFRKHGRRDNLIVATKATGPGIHVAHIRKGRLNFDLETLDEAVDASLRRLQSDYIDLYLLQWPERATNYFGQLGYKPAQRSEQSTVERTLTALERLVRSGKIRAVGLSNETPWGLMSFLHCAQTLDLPLVVAIQNPYNLLNRSFETGLAEISDRECASLVAYSPLAFGTLTGKYANGARPPDARVSRYSRFLRYTNDNGIVATEKYLDLAREFDVDPAHMAISFILTRRYVASVLVGATTEKQLRHNLRSTEITLSKQHLNAIDKIHTQIPNPCP